ncbi:4'-phosphopantetheinyl transferase family protein [Janthinobacterium lividum]|uniref:4'-phosphopantetheinyl transferase family protein n=1 Tax=Janthinobacterium lividum TaxID=29581 RepID=UPI000873E4FF|nr:4'-phosphopantetheinyl transferase superfamily protein [Janthinobacterium lividum]MCC7716662.1 4'-phosphopantetheinyl transferase superfamily protein [Janthinobacterium lividum]OEZ64522.1 4'-phosphopantetheinyl transferase sfp [Janthinobacterium lividum]WQE32004.1 4'-phosphopantetheinyl transferase superfamily protein [Janthinobacterium lividum]STS86003.1 4'-phosphopantetheinyl transferase sfp [Janthinobacterium lividum]
MPAHPNSSEQDIDLWLAYYNEIGNPQLQSQLRELLSDAERGQEKRFHFADDRLRYLVTRAMVRTVLSRYATVAPNDWEFALNAYGRPDIAPHHDVRGLCFNISHTRDLITLAVSRHCGLGVDVENLAVRRPALEIANLFFSPVEAAELASLNQERRRDRFFEYWTLKESYSKARGMGLSLPLDQFSFHFPNERLVRLSIDAKLGDIESRWRFWQCRPTPNHLLALCAERQSGAIPLITVREVVPTLRDVIIETEWLKTSDERGIDE